MTKKNLLILGGSGKLGMAIKSCLVDNSTTEIFITQRSSEFKFDATKNILYGDLSNPNHLNATLSFRKKYCLIDCSVFRNPPPVKEIRSYETFLNEVQKTYLIMQHYARISSQLVMSSGTVFTNIDMNEAPVDHVLTIVKKFMHEDDHRAIHFYHYVSNKFSKANNFWEQVKPMNHINDNQRLNGQSKFLTEIAATEIYRRTGVKTFIIRSPRIIF